MAKIGNVAEAKAKLSKLIELALAGEEVIIAKRGKPVARLIPEKPKKRELGLFDFEIPTPSSPPPRRGTRRLVLGGRRRRMKRYLLDTHALFFAVARPHRLSSRPAAAIEDPEAELWVSSASAWEAATKYRLGKLPHAEPLLLDYYGSLTRIGALNLPITSAHALLAGSFKADPKDPFGRILAAQAQLENLTLISKDPTLDAFGVRRLW